MDQDSEFRKFLESIAWLADCEIRYRGKYPMGCASLDSDTGKIERREIKPGDSIDPVFLAQTIWSIVNGRYLAQRSEDPSVENAVKMAELARRHELDRKAH